MPLREKMPTQVTSDKAGPAGNQNFHEFSGCLTAMDWFWLEGPGEGSGDTGEGRIRGDFQIDHLKRGSGKTGSAFNSVTKIQTCHYRQFLLLFFVVEDPTNEQNASYNNNQRYNDSNWRSHLFDQVEDHSHVLIPFSVGFLFA